MRGIAIAEALENRRLLALTASMVRDISPGSGDSSPTELVGMNGSLYFAADDGNNGIELWKSDGSAQGTVLVKDINPGAAGSAPSFLTNVNGTLFFAAIDGVHGSELWKSDGTEAGTVLVRDITLGTTGFSPANLLAVSNTLFFAKAFGSGLVGLWRSDGTEDGTVLVVEVGGFSTPHDLTTSSQGLYFLAGGEGGNERRIWLSTGDSEAGSRVVAEAVGISDLTIVNDTVFFTFRNGSQLWTANRPVPGDLALVEEINPDPDFGGDPVSTDFVEAGGTLYFSADDGVSGRGLWRSDGTIEGTFLLKVVPKAANFISNGGTIFFTADEELWASDGTAAGTTRLATFGSRLFNSLSDLAVAGGTLYFGAETQDGGKELGKSDGTAAGTETFELNDGSASSSPAGFTKVGNTVFFAATTASGGRELWQLCSGDPPPQPPLPPTDDDQISEARLIPLNQPVGDTISDAVDVDMFKITVAAGQQVAIDLDRPAGSSLDSQLRLFSYDAATNTAAEIGKNNNAAAPGETLGTDSYLEHTFASAGTFYIGVSGSPNTAYGPVSGNDGTGGTTGGYVLSVQTGDTTPPSAVLEPVAPVATAGAAGHQFVVRYEDASGIDRNSLDRTEVEVRSPGGSLLPVESSSIVVDGTGTVTTVTYIVAAPGGSFDAPDSGTYTISLRGSAVRDTLGNPADARVLGTFPVSIVVVTPPPPPPPPLIVGMSGSLPAAVLAGARASVKLTVAIEHTSGTPISGPVGAGVFLSNDDTLDAADVPLASSSKATKLRKGATHKEIKLVIRQFPSVPAGDYRVLVQATAAGATRSFEASRLSVAPPHVDLTASQLFATIRPSPRGGLALGGSILLGNDGNISAKGSVAVALFVSTDGTYDATDVPLGTATVRVGLKPGARKAAKFKLNSFLVLPSGGYTLVAILNANSQLAESNQTNNTVVGPTISV